MAMKFNSQGCKDAAQRLSTSGNNIDKILNEKLERAISILRESYQSDTADKLLEAYAEIKAKFPQFIEAITECSDYLVKTVAPAYEKIESTAASKIEI